QVIVMLTDNVIDQNPHRHIVPVNGMIVFAGGCLVILMQFGQHLIHGNPLSRAGLRQWHFSAAAEIDAILFKDSSPRMPFGYEVGNGCFRGNQCAHGLSPFRAVSSWRLLRESKTCYQHIFRQVYPILKERSFLLLKKPEGGWAV